MIWKIAIAAALLSLPALAAPPPGAHDPVLSEWFKSLRREGDRFPCCSEADCRRVEEVSEPSDHYRVAIKREQFVNDEMQNVAWNANFGDANTAVVDVPDSTVVVRNDNPTGSAILCYSVFSAKVYCFVPFDWKY